MILTSTNPRTGETHHTALTASTPADLDAAVSGAEVVARRFRRCSRAQRSALLRAIADELEASRDPLAQTADEETALGLPRLTGEVGRTAFQLRAFASVLDDGAYLELNIDHAGETSMGPRPDLRRTLVPLGPVAVFGASNFPFAFSVAGGDTASALAAGCPVIVKAHSSHPRTAHLTFAAIQKAIASVGEDKRIVSIVYGREAGTALVEHQRVKAVGFTGSQHGGRALFDRAQQRREPIPFYGELGSVNPVVVTTGAARENAEQIAEEFVASMTLGGGQFCTKPGLLFVPAGEEARFRDSLERAVGGADATWSLNASIQSAYQRGVSALSEAVGDDNIVISRSNVGPGFSVLPAIAWATLGDLQVDKTPLVDECFGPVAVAVSYDDADDLLEFLSDFPGALAASVMATDDDDEAAQVLDVLSGFVGRVVWNEYATGVAVASAMTHGGPYPSSTNSLHTSVGATAIRRFLRPVTFQSVPEHYLAAELRDSTPLAHKRDGRTVVQEVARE